MSDPNQMPQDGPFQLDSPGVPEVTGRPMDAKKQPKKKDQGPIPARKGHC